MAIIETAPERISGPWEDGWVLARHIVRSIPTGNNEYGRMQFDTLRTPLGEVVHQFKNRNGSPDDIIETALDFIQRRWQVPFDGVVPMPASIRRIQQPADVLADALAAGLGTRTRGHVVQKTTRTEAMKNVPRANRAQILSGAIVAGTERVDGMTVLLVDDLWETGATMRRVAEVVRAQGAKALYAVALTRTR